MAFRAYMLTGLSEGTEREELITVLKAFEAMDEVSFVEAVVGPYDLLVSVQSAPPGADVAARLRKVEKVEEVVTLKVSPVPVRERMWKNIKELPGKASA